MVTDDELDALRAQPEAFKDVIAERWEQYQRLFDYEPVFVVNGRVPGLDEMTRRDSRRVATAGVGDGAQRRRRFGRAGQRAGACRARRRRPAEGSSRATC